jgi:hypothetical protein
MLIFKLMVATLIIVVAFVALYHIQKQLKGEAEGLSFSSKKDTRGSREELDAFIAAYQRDKLTNAAVQPQPATAHASAPVAAAAPSAAWKPRASFLATPSKLAFLVLKAGLPDHHVFANTRLADLIEAPNAAPLANLRVDLVVCSKELAIVAAIDVASNAGMEESSQGDKAKCLHAAGIRYLRFSTNAFPKPAEVRKLVYPQ